MNVWVVESFDMKSWLPEWHGIFSTEERAQTFAVKLRMIAPSLDVVVEVWEVDA